MKFLFGSVAKSNLKKVRMVKSKKPRVLMLYDFPITGGGSGAYVKYLTLRLQEAYKYDIAIAAPDKQSPDPKIKFFRLRLPQIPVFIGRPGLEKSKKYSDLTPQEIAGLYDAYVKETIRVVEAFKPDIIHVHHMMVNAWAARVIRSLYGTKFIVTSHGSCLYAIAKDRRYFRLTRDALVASNLISVISGDVRAKLLKMFGSELSAKTRTITGGVRLSFFPERKNPKELQLLSEKLDLVNKPVVLFTGRLISEKGVEYLVKAAGKIKGQVVIAGDGPQKENLKKLIKDLKLKNVILVGHFDYTTLINLYYLANVFVSPAVWDEPLGLTTIEAMAAGKPVVVTRKGGMATAIKDGVTGLFVRPRNASDIAEKVNSLLDDPVMARKMGARARKIVIERFTWTKIAQQFHTVYSKL